MTKENLNPLNLSYHLSPTEDASELFFYTDRPDVLFFENGRKPTWVVTHQYLYLTSKREIVGGYYYSEIENDVTKNAHKAELDGSVERFKLVKVEFTTDPALIKDGVTALPEKARIYCLNCNKGEIKHAGGCFNCKDVGYIEVTLLSEFVSRYNNRNVKGKCESVNHNLQISMYGDCKVCKGKELYQKQSANVKGVDVEKLAKEVIQKYFRAFKSDSIYNSTIQAMVDMYNQALQSNVGEFSLEDIRKIYDEGIDFGMAHSDGVFGKEYKYKMLDRLLQSLTPSKQSGEVEMYVEMEFDRTIIVKGNNEQHAEPTFKIKLKDGQPIIHFK